MCFSECVSSKHNFTRRLFTQAREAGAREAPLAGARTSDRTDAGLAPAPVRLPRHGTERHLQPGQVVGVAARGREERQPRARGDAGLPQGLRVFQLKRRDRPPPRLELVELLCALVVVPVRRVEQRHVQRVDRELLEQQQLHAPYRVVVVHDERTRAADGVEPGEGGGGGARRRFPPLLLARGTDDAPAPCVGSPARRAGVSVVRKRQVLRVRRRGGDIFFRLRPRRLAPIASARSATARANAAGETRTRRTETAWDT